MQDGGVIDLELDEKAAPITVENFLKLVNAKFYDGTIFHRVIAGFMIQGGDPQGTGMGGPGWTIKGEFAQNGVDNPISHKRGVISMARAMDPDSAGSQFFIMHADGEFLDGQYAAFGHVVNGMDVVDRIASAKTNRWAGDRPYEDQVMETVRVVEE
jgi:peptidyl-prolyl cis-trans isomerase B (cyclophilin B)